VKNLKIPFCVASSGPEHKIKLNLAISGGFDVFGFTAHDYNNELKNKATKTFSKMSDLQELIKSER